MQKKPKQGKITQYNATGDLAEALENAMGYIRDAMEELKGFAEFEDWFNMLDDLDTEMFPVFEEYNTAANADYADQVRELEREYWRSVL